MATASRGKLPWRARDEFALFPVFATIRAVFGKETWGVVQGCGFVRAPFCFAYDFTEAGNPGAGSRGAENGTSGPTQTFPDSLVL